jgi:hypothetical protein
VITTNPDKAIDEAKRVLAMLTMKPWIVSLRSLEILKSKYAIISVEIARIEDRTSGKWTGEYCVQANLQGEYSHSNLCYATERDALDGLLDVLQEKVDQVKNAARRCRS